MSHHVDLGYHFLTEYLIRLQVILAVVVLVDFSKSSDFVLELLYLFRVVFCSFCVLCSIDGVYMWSVRLLCIRCLIVESVGWSGLHVVVLVVRARWWCLE